MDQEIKIITNNFYLILIFNDILLWDFLFLNRNVCRIYCTALRYFFWHKYALIGKKTITIYPSSCFSHLSACILWIEHILQPFPRWQKKAWLEWMHTYTDTWSYGLPTSLSSGSRYKMHQVTLSLSSSYPISVINANMDSFWYSKEVQYQGDKGRVN